MNSMLGIQVYLNGKVGAFHAAKVCYQEGYILGYLEISNCHNVGYMPVLT